MDSSDSIAELVKVVLRVRPRVDSLPAHPQHNVAISNSTQDPTCVSILGRHQVKILSSKILSVNSVAETFGSPSGREKKEKIFNFETILGPDSTQENTYSTVSDTVYSSVLGYNAAIFAYGSTGTGKTYTMTGTRHHPGLIPRVIEDIFRGIQNVRSQNKEVMFHVELSYVEMYNNGFRNLLRAVSDEVSRVEAINGDSDMLQSELDELLQVGISEAAFEQGVSRFVDLSHKLDKITVHESAATGVYLCGPNIRIPVQSVFAAHRLFAIGNKQRAETTRNSYDRSHAVMTMHIESKVTFREGGAVDSHPENTSSPPNQEKKSGRDTPSAPNTLRSELRLGKIHLVDLAGSERLSETKAEGDKMTETQNINKSLLALGEVLHALALNASIYSKNTRKRSLGEGRTSRDASPSLSRRPSQVGSHSPSEHRPPTVSGEMHVPYLNSKLTHLLKDSLGGNSKTVMIATIACESEQYAHILHSLNYASRAMKVRNLVHPVRVEIAENELTSDLSNERDVINQLKERIMNRGPNGRERPLPRYPSVGRPVQAASNGSVRGASPMRSGQMSSSQSVTSLSSAGTATAAGSRRPRTAASPSPVRNRLPGQQKAYTLKLNSIQAQQLQYVSFPLCPVLKFTVDKQQAATSKNLYSRSVATFPESFEFEVGALKYRSGLDLSVQAVNVSPLTGELVPIGEGSVDIQTVLPTLNAQQTVTIELQNALMQPAGLVLIGAVLLDRPMGNSISYPTPTHTSFSHAPQTPHTPSAVQGTPLEFDPTRRPSDVKDGVFRVDRIVCHDLALPTTINPITGKAEPPKSELFVEVQVGDDSLRTDAIPGKCKQNNVYAAFDRPNMVVDVEYDQLPSETLHAAVFEVSTIQNKPTKKCVGCAKAPLFSLVGRNDGIYTPASEFAMQLKDDDSTPVGKISLFLLFSKNNQPLRVDTSRSLFASPTKTGISSPTKHLRSLGMSPRLNNIRVPAGFNTGWIRISSIAATNLNKFRLVGNTAKYKNLRDAPMTPVPSYLKHSELLGKQDPFLVVEAGDFWGSYSKVLLNQGWDCRWDQAAFCCYLNHVEAAEESMRVSVYDRSCSGYHNVFIGFASLPLINMFAAKRVTETTIEMNVVDRRGKVNGKLQLKYTWEPSDGKERWSNGIITRVCGDGSYDVRYDDGDEEFAVFKDVIRLISRSKQMHPALGSKRSFTAGLFRFQNGDKVEVNDKGRGLWFPARVVRDNGDGSYDLESDYDVQKHGVNADHLRIIEAEQSVRAGHKRTDSFSRRLDFDGSVATGAGCKGKYKVRDMVEGNYKCKGTWYVGKVIKVHSYEQHCTYDIDYLTGEYESEVAEDMIRTESTHTVLVGATSAYDLRQLRETRSEVSVVVPLQRTGFSGADAAKARAAGGRGEKTQSKFQAGQDVEVNFRGHGRFYPGVVEVDYENGVYDIVYESGERDVDIAEDFLRIPEVTERGAEGGSPDKQLVLSKMYKFEVGDRVEANFREIGKFIPGIITRDRGHGVFDIHYYDGRDESKVSFELIRLADPNVFFSPTKRSKFVVGQSVECNCERLGVWYHAQIRNVFPDGVYNIQYDDGETEYDVEEDMLRPGGAYSPGIPSLKPFFKVGDRVKVACRSQEVDHELRSLSAIKQRIMEERKRLAEGKLVVAKRGAMQEQVNDAVAAAHRTLQGFKTRVGYSGELSCCQAENNLRSDDDDAEGFTRVSSQSFRKLEEVESAFAGSDPTAPKPTELEAIESLNDAITKAIVVEQSLGHIARASKEEELAKAHSAHLLSVAEKEKADELALARAIDEAKARKRNNFSREEEMRTVRDAYQKAELELGHIMAARQLVLEQDEALKNAKQRADLEARCMNGAQRKGEKAAIRLKEEDRQRLAMAEFNVKEAHRNGHHHHHHHGKKSKLGESPGDQVRSSLGPDGAREREALREALIRVKETNAELNEAKSRAAQAGREFAAADSLAQSTQKELQDILDTNRQAEYTLTEDSTLTSEFKEYLKAADAIASYTAQANSKRQRKDTDLHKAETATQLRMRTEESAAVAAEKRVFAEESMILAARSGEMEAAMSAMREANSYGEQQGDEIVAATTASRTEAAELVTAKVFAEDERKLYASARDIAVLASGLLRVIIADQREREYQALEEAKSAARTVSNELESLSDIIAARDIRRINTTAAAETEALGIAQFRTRLAHMRSNTSTTSATTAEKTALNLKIVRAQNGRYAAEEDMQRLMQERMLLEENARVAQKKGGIEESIAQSCAEEEASREIPQDRFTDPVKREQLLHFSSYSADECKAVRMATSHIEDQCTALQEAKACAIMQIDAIDNCRECVQEEFGSLSSLSVIERDELRVLLPALSVAELQEHLATSKVRAIEANRALSAAKQKAAERKKLLQASKDKTSDVLEQLAKAQAITQNISPKDFSLDRMKASIVEGAQLAVREALSDASYEEKARQALESVVEASLQSAIQAAHRASGSERLRNREEETTRQAVAAAEGICMDDEEQLLSLLAACTHSDAQIEALREALDAVERETDDLVTARQHSEKEGESILKALAKEENILLVKSEWNQQKAEADLGVAKKLLDGRIVLMNNAQNALERDALALDVMVGTLERAAKELVTRGDDDIDDFRGYQRAFKRYQCKRQKALEYHKHRDNKKSKAEMAHHAREVEEDVAVATENRVSELEHDASVADSHGNVPAEVKALREARKLCNESANALAAAKEYAAAEEELYGEAQDEMDEEKLVLRAARDHAEEAWILLAKALSVLPVKHRTPMGLMLLNGGDGFFNGVVVRPRKKACSDKDDEKLCDPGLLQPLPSDMDNVHGNHTLRAADFKDDEFLPDRDSKLLSFQFDANPKKAALREAQESVDRAFEFLTAAKSRTEDAEKKYRIANAAATEEGKCVAAQEQENAATARRLSENCDGVEAEKAQLAKVRADLNSEDKNTANLRGMKESEVKKVAPFAQNRKRCEDLAGKHAADRAKAEEAAQQAHRIKDVPVMERALADAKKHCDLQAGALNEAAQSAAKECSAWGNGTNGANKEKGSAEKAHALADEEARLLGLIRAAQLGQGMEAYRAACREAEGAKDYYEDTLRGMDGFAQFVDDLKAANAEREAELTEDTKALPAYQDYEAVRNKLDDECKRAHVAHDQHDQEVANALAAREVKAADGVEAEKLDDERVAAEDAAHDAHQAGDKEEASRLAEEARQLESAVEDAYSSGTDSAHVETEAWKAAARHLEDEKDALTAAHEVSLEATALLVQLRADQIDREMASLRDASNHAQECANRYDEANVRARQAAEALTKSRNLLSSREAALGKEVKSIPDYSTYLDLVDAALSADDQASEFEQEKLSERALVDDVIATKKQCEEGVAAATAKRTAATVAVLEAQSNDDIDSEQQAMEELKQLYDNEEKALQEAKEHAEEEAHRWGIATDFADEEGSARIVAKDRTNEALRLLTRLLLEKERADVEAKKADVLEEEQAYRKLRDAVGAAKAKTAELVEACRMPSVVTEEVKNSPEYDRYQSRFSTVSSDANRPVVDHDVINAAEIERAKDARQSCSREEVAAGKANTDRNKVEVSAEEMRQLPDLAEESKAVDQAGDLFNTEEKALLSALQHAQNEWVIWRNLKLLSEKELKAANGLNDRAEDAARLLTDLLTSEKGRMAEACGAAMDRAAQCETDYYAINKKTLARNVTLSNTIAKSQALNLSLTEPCRSSREYQQFQAVLEHNDPLVEEAKSVKREKEGHVTAAEALKAQRIALEQSLNAGPKNAHRTNSVKELMAKFEKNDSISSKRAAQLAESSMETLTALHAIATDEAVTWDKAIDSTTREKGLYSSSNALFEEALLLQAAAASNQRERELATALSTAEEAANHAKEEFYSLCEVLDVKEQELATALESKEAVKQTVLATDPAILNSAAYTRAQGKLDKENSRLVASKESKEAAITKATALVEARQGEKTSAIECAGKQRRVVVEVTYTTGEESPAASPIPMPSAALPRLDKHLCAVQYKPRAVDDPPDIRPTSVGVRVNDGSTVNWQSLTAKFPDFGLAKRDQTTIHNAMQALFQERTAADTEEKSLEQAAIHAVEEEKAWRLALQYAQAEVAALDGLCAATGDAAGVLAGLKNDLDAQQAEEQAQLEDACGDAKTEADKFAALNGECEDLGRTFEEKKEDIAERDAELNSESKATPDHKAFEGLQDELNNQIEPAILTARAAKLAAAESAGKLTSEKEVQLRALEAAKSAQSEPDARLARAAALDSATQEAAAWADANTHAETEAGLLRPGIGKENEALALLQDVKAAQVQRDNDTLGAAVADADAAHKDCSESFAEADRKHALFSEELGKMSDKKAEILPETRTSPTFRKFEKLEAELEDEDKPFIFTKRDARVAAASEAEELVTANQRTKPSVESAEAERAAWTAAGDLAKEEIAGLDKGISKAREAQGLLDKAQLEELNKQGGDSEAGLLDAKNRAGDAEAELAQLEAQITDARANIGKMQEENTANAAVVRGKGQEFAADIAAHDLTQKSIDAALANADAHRDIKTDYLGRAKVEKLTADEEEDAYYKGRPLSDPSLEAARRRDALVNANKRAQTQCEHLSTATTEARSELDELKKAETAAKNDQNSLGDARSARSYRTRMGYMILSGDDEMIPVPKRKPFDNIPIAAAQGKIIDATRMKRPANHEDEEIKPAARLPMARSEVDCDAFGDDSCASKVLFEVGGGWTAQIAAQAKKYLPYALPEADEYMPARSYKHEIPKAQVSDAPPPAFFIRNEDGSVSEDRLCGKALFIAVVKHIIQLNRVVRRLKPLQEGELEEIKGRITKSQLGMHDTTQFLGDNTKLQSRAGRSLTETGSADLGLSLDEIDEYATSGPSTGGGSQLSPAVRRIASNIDAFLSDMQRKDALIVSETNSSKSNSAASSGKTGGAFANMAKVAMKLNKVKARIPKPKGVDAAQFQPRRPVDDKSITSLLYGGGPADSVDVAVLDDEGEDVVETTKQTTTDTTRSEEKSERHTVDEEHTEETEVTQTTTIAPLYGTNAPRITAAAAGSSQQSPAPQSQQQSRAQSSQQSPASQSRAQTQFSQQASPVPSRSSAPSSQVATGPSSPMPLAMTSDDADFGTAYEDFHDPDFPEPSPFGSGMEGSTNGRFSPVTTAGNSTQAQSFKSTGPDSVSSTGGSAPASKKLQRATSNSSLVSSGSSKRRPADSSLMAEMMSGNLDL